MSRIRIRRHAFFSSFCAVVQFAAATAFAQDAPVPGAAPAPAGEATTDPTAPPAPPTPEVPPQPTENLATTTPDAPAPAAAAPAAAVEPAAERELADSIRIADEGFFKPGATLQFWIFADHGDDWQSTLRVRRAELKIAGELLRKRLAYKVMIDPARAPEFNSVDLEVEGQEPEPATPGTVTVQQPSGSTSILQDVEITYLSEFVDVTAGQFKVPLSWEGFNSSSKLLFPERALISRQYGDRRDIGILASKKIGPLYYALGVFNGQGQNRLDNSNQKDVAARLEFFPIEPLMIAGAGYVSVGSRDEPQTKDRVEVDARFEDAGALLQAEYLHGWDGSTDADRTEGRGFYVAGGYTILDQVQPILRVGMLDTNLDADDDETWHYELGVNYYVSGHGAKFQLSGSIFDPATGDSTEQFIAATQLAF